MSYERTVNPKNKLIPSYIQLKQILAARIRETNKEFKLPSIRTLIKEHRISQATVDKALLELEADGLIQRRGTTGIFSCIPQSDAHDEVFSGATGGDERRMVGIFMEDMVNFFPPIIRAAEGILRRHGYYPVLHAGKASLERCEFFTALILQNQMAGALIVPRETMRFACETLLEREIPLVFATGSMEGLATDAILTNDHEGGYLAARHLLANGHRRIAMAVAPGEPSASRLQGLRDAFAEAGESVDNDLLCPPETFRDQERVKALLRDKSATAIMAYNDVQAVELYWLLRGLGVDVPGDISLMGYDDAEIVAISGIRLSTIAQPFSQIGRLAAETLIKRIERCHEPRILQRIEPSLMVRETTSVCVRDEQMEGRI